ncbi:hypothetical protein MMC11_007994 [Xylographa trunciseda]|nr:hypothetical protein [Xylographa trunciseda]
METEDKNDKHDQRSSAEPMDLIQVTASPPSGRNAIDSVAEGTTLRGDVGSLDSTPKGQDGDSDTIRVEATQVPGKSQSPILISSREASSNSTSTLAADLDLGGEAFAVVVRPISRRWEYKTYDVDPRVKSVVAEVQEGRRLSYKVKSRDGRAFLISFEQLLQLPGGSRALEKYENETSSHSSSSDSSASGTIMVSSRATQSRRRREVGFVDISQLNLSDEDELNNTDGGNFWPKRKRRLLSAPKPPPRRGSRVRASRAESEFSSDSSKGGIRKRHRVSSKGRVLRAARSTVNQQADYDDTLPDEYDVSSSGDSYARLGKRKRAQYRAAAVTRRSERSGRVSGSMRERGEDDIPDATNIRTSSRGAAKVTGAKEQFVPLSKTDDFRLHHCQSCDTCGDYGDNEIKGQLVFCQGCTTSYHQACLGPRNAREHLVTKFGHQDFVLQCRRCVETARKKESTAPRQSQCQICHEGGKSCKPFRDRKTAREEQREREENSGEDPITSIMSDRINNVANLLFRCTGCYQAFHMHHLPPKNEERILDGADDDQIAAERFGEYCRTWTCYDCATAPGEIDALVAWRPLDIETYVSGQTTEQVEEDDKEYLVKWKRMSYYKVVWKRGAWVWGITHPAMRKAFARQNNGNNLPKMRTEDAVPEEYLRVDIVFEVKYNSVVSTRTEQIELARVKEVAKAKVKFKGLGYEDVVWEEPPDSEDGERWDDWKMAYEDWVQGHYIKLPNQPKLKAHIAKVKAQNFESKIMMKEQPKTLTGGELMDYQMEGMNWLLYQWHSGHNAILADEMGLGKTIQIIAFLSTLQKEHKCWPFLVVVPNSTCANWRREIKLWAPSLRVVTYFGSSEARKLAHQFELFPESKRELACHVVVTSYDAAQDVSVQTVLRRIPWAGLIVDEGQRLKNDKNILYSALTSLKAPFKVLLTGTPLQNNQRELFNLLQFLDNTINAEALEEQYAVISKDNVAELHELLRPFFLRRTKAQVLKFLPPMAQIIVPVTASALQKELYKTILAKNPDLLRSIIGGDRKASVKGLRNLLMQLRKCLCHPFVYNMEIEERTANVTVSHRRLVEASSKLQLLEIMLPKLHERGHRVLIFSQFLDMMTIVEDFLDGLGLLHQRLDGTIGSLEKQKRIDEFNAPDSSLFVFLLSTRAGGVGINLATADTVIILDPDFNPHQDIQAISRAHRIGQKKKVLIFQLMTRGTAEEKIMQIGKKKMALDHVLIEQMDADDADNNDLESVLRFGAEALFKDDSTQDIHYDSSSVDKLLDRSQIEDTKTGKDNSAESQFSFARVWANETGTMEDKLGTSDDEAITPDSSLWDKILHERKLQAEKEALMRAETLGRGKRHRHAIIDYTKQATADGEVHGSPGRDAERDDTDTDFQSRGDSDGEESADEVEQVNLDELRAPEDRPSRSVLISNDSTLPKAGNFRRAHITSPPTPTTLPDQLPCLACNNAHGSHPIGYCPLKIAGVEYCNLCGLAHFAIGRVCPHINSETQVSQMLRDLCTSPESRDLVEQARKYLRGVKADLVNRKRKEEAARLRSSELTTQGQSHATDKRVGFSHPHTANNSALNGHRNATQGTNGSSLVFSQPPAVNGQYTTPHVPPLAAAVIDGAGHGNAAARSFSSFNHPPASAQA